MAPKARKTKTIRKAAAGGAKKSVNIEMVKDAVAALRERNGSTINAILNYLVRTKQVSRSSRTLVILAIGRACREGSMAKKSPNTFVLKEIGRRKVSSPKQRKRKAKRAKKRTTKSAAKRRRRQRKRKGSRKPKRGTKRRNRKATRKTRKPRRSRKATPAKFRKPVAAMRRRPARRAARRINYRE
ncbi:sperm-specific H1/protamine-like protein type 2 [Xenia sp. Carnegie-2017]|uniref:sperm-specific H1/protamine-like protein type 2 n=1 Tax=Xenia sp. Carnegie-2017 TaxID=2897299 RepID=UPI001F03E02E|nr:sperm-specific H1/protamine-like protein type 2 [Xenia sp. Carnegie-2017]